MGRERIKKYQTRHSGSPGGSECSEITTLRRWDFGGFAVRPGETNSYGIHFFEHGLGGLTTCGRGVRLEA
jgi:hypothetical protein